MVQTKHNFEPFDIKMGFLQSVGAIFEDVSAAETIF